MTSLGPIAECINDGDDSNGPYVVATNYGFSIPSGAQIDGIEVELYLIGAPDGPSPDMTVEQVRIVKGGTISGTDLSDFFTIPVASVSRTYGSDSQLWGLSWTDSDINASNFGVALQVSTDRNNDVRIDSIRVTVYYTEA